MRIIVFSLSLIVYLFFPAHTRADNCETKMVFLVEDHLGKHVGVSKNSRSYSLLASDSSWNLYPTISNDSSLLAYAKGSSQSDLVLILKDFKNNLEIPLTPPGFIVHPQFSKNGRMLFFSIKKDGVNKIGFINLSKIPKNTLPKIQYINESNPSFFPAPFQSGEALVYQRNAEKKEIILLDLLTGKKEIIGTGMSPALSKDERFIAYTSKRDTNWNIFIYDRFQKTTVQATSSVARNLSPTFDRNNNLIFTSDRMASGIFSIYTKSYQSWQTTQNTNPTLLISQNGVSFYAPKISGCTGLVHRQNPAMPGVPRSSFGAISHQNKVYVIGGHQGAEHTYPPESFTGRVTVYNIKEKLWQAKSSRLNPSHGFGLAASGNYIYAFGGFAYEESNYPKWKSLDVVERYDIQKDKWEAISTMPRRRSSNAVVQIDDKVYLIGGWDSTPKFHGDIDGTFHQEIDVFNLKNNTWETLKTSLPMKRRAFSAFSKDGISI